MRGGLAYWNRFIPWGKAQPVHTDSIVPVTHQAVLSSLLVSVLSFLSFYSSHRNEKDGSHVRTGGLPQDHFQRREAREAAGTHPALVQGRHQVSAKNATTRCVFCLMMFSLDPGGGSCRSAFRLHQNFSLPIIATLHSLDLAHLCLFFSVSLAAQLPTLSMHSSSLLRFVAGYIGEFEIVDDHRGQKIVIELTGRLNKCGVISPRFDVGYDELEKWVVNLLPSRQFGHIVISTTYGIMTHEEARRKKTGGKILGFFY